MSGQPSNYLVQVSVPQPVASSTYVTSTPYFTPSRPVRAFLPETHTYVRPSMHTFLPPARTFFPATHIRSSPLYRHVPRVPEI